MGTVVSEEAAAAIGPRQANAAVHSTIVGTDSEGRRTFDAAEFETTHVTRLIGAGALLIIAFQVVYTTEGCWLHPQGGPAALALHLFNIAAGMALLAVTRTKWFSWHWKPIVWALVVALMASTAGISVLEVRTEPLFASVLLLLVGAGGLAPWDRNWQGSIEVVGLVCLAAASWLVPLTVYQWLTLLTAVGLAHCCVALGERYRAEFAKGIDRLTDFQTHLRDKVLELERAERRARESEEAMRQIIESSLDIISITRFSDGKYVRLNPEFETSGFEIKESIGRSAFRVNEWADKGELKRYLERLTTRKRVRNMEASFKLKNGNIVPCLISSVVIDFRGEPCVVSFVRDVTRMKEVEHKLRRSEATLSKIIETSPDLIAINRLSDGRFTAVNNSFVQIAGVSKEEIAGKTPRDLSMWADPDQFSEFLGKLRSESVVRSMEVDFRGRDGRLSPFLVSAVLTDLDGEPSVVSFSRNITEIKEAENQLRSAREAALAATRAKSEFLSSMSHEIRTPMNAMLGMAELLGQSSLSEEQRRYINIMRANGDALLDLINDILDLAKIESGRLTLEHANFDLDDLVDKIGEMMAVRAHEKRLELATRIAPDVPLGLVGDPLRVRQILLNLLGNAIKFTEKGDIVLAVERVDGKPANGSEPQVTLRFSVSDTGIGIPQEKLGVIFSSFAQADSSTTRRYGGSGLGLAIVKRLVELHGGEISVMSVVGRGTCFSFTASFGVRGAAVRPRLDLDGARVLVVDDSEINRLILREILAREGGQVTEARSGAEALAELERALTQARPYRLLLLDCRMPEMDGLEVARRVKSLYQHDSAQLPCLVMLTSDDLGVQLARLREIGIQTYLVKPVRRSELIGTIARAMGEAAVAASAPAPCEDAIGSRLHPLRILLADDSAVNRMLIRAFFGGTPWQLEEAEDGQAAVDKFKSEKFDLVLMDMRMPVADGYTATRSIRNWERENHLPPTPIVALTASALEEEVRRCLEAGCDAHVSKPVRRATLLHTIEAATRGAPGSLDRANGHQ